MKKILIALACMIAGYGTMAQKIDVKKDKITVDDADYAMIEKDGCGALSPSCVYCIKSPEGKG